MRREKRTMNASRKKKGIAEKCLGKEVRSSFGDAEASLKVTEHTKKADSRACERVHIVETTHRVDPRGCKPGKSVQKVESNQHKQKLKLQQGGLAYPLGYAEESYLNKIGEVTSEEKTRPVKKKKGIT